MITDKLLEVNSEMPLAVGTPVSGRHRVGGGSQPPPAPTEHSERISLLDTQQHVDHLRGKQARLPAIGAWLGQQGVETAVAGKSASALRMQGAARQVCIAPRFLANVFLAGEVTFEAKLHRLQARTAATVASLFLSESPTIVLQMPTGESTGKPIPHPCSHHITVTWNSSVK